MLLENDAELKGRNLGFGERLLLISLMNIFPENWCFVHGEFNLILFSSLIGLSQALFCPLFTTSRIFLFNFFTLSPPPFPSSPHCLFYIVFLSCSPLI